MLQFTKSFHMLLLQAPQQAAEGITALIYVHIADKEIETENAGRTLSTSVRQPTIGYCGPRSHEAFALGNFPCILSLLLRRTNCSMVGGLLLSFGIGERLGYS